MSNDEVTAVSEIGPDRWAEAVQWHSHFEQASDIELDERMAEWVRWKSDPRNEEVYFQLSKILESSSAARKRAIPSVRPLENAIPKDQPFVPPVLRPPPNAPRPKSRLPRVVKLIALAAALSAATLNLPIRQIGTRSDRLNFLPGIHRTLVGEVRSDTLPDGSVVTLGADSEVSVQFSADTRAATLKRGEAWFKVAHDATRPFGVTAGERTIVALGTAFVVRRTTDQVIVTVTDGAVEVSPRDLTEPQSYLLHALHAVTDKKGPRLERGQQLRYANSGTPGPIERADPQSATSWSEGELQFHNVALCEVVQVVNRYSHRAIAVDSHLGRKPFTGLILTPQIDEWLRELAVMYSAELTVQGGTVWIHSTGDGSDHPLTPCDAAS